jgi:predicted ATP-grasp superfamily ATP-dependent carboligase
MRDSEPLPAIVVGLEHPRAVAVINSLGQMGVPVIGIDRKPPRRAGASRFLSKSHVATSREQVIELLLALGERGGVLIPTTDEYIIIVAQNWERLSERFRLSIPRWEVVEPLMDLAASYALAESVGLRTPRTFRPRDREELEAIVASLDLSERQYLLRTPAATVPADTRWSRYTRSAGADAGTMLERCQEIHGRLGAYPTIIEAVPLDSEQCIGVHLVADAEHETRVAYCLKRLTVVEHSRGRGFVHPYELGTHVFCTSVRDEEALDAARRFVRKAGYVGLIAVEFRRDPRDGALVFVKADVCLPRELNLGAALGIDAPAALYRTLTEAPQATRLSHREGVSWFWPSEYLSTLWANRSDGPVRRELLGLLRQLLRVRTMAYWNSSDPKPFLVDTGLWLKVALGWSVRQAPAKVWAVLRKAAPRA